MRDPILLFYLVETWAVALEEKPLMISTLKSVPSVVVGGGGGGQELEEIKWNFCLAASVVVSLSIVSPYDLDSSPKHTGGSEPWDGRVARFFCDLGEGIHSPSSSSSSVTESVYAVGLPTFQSAPRPSVAGSVVPELSSFWSELIHPNYLLVITLGKTSPAHPVIAVVNISNWPKWG